jgi:outer membrane receptor for ferric coprogen and ferric-rhodotorulic acid
MWCRWCFLRNGFQNTRYIRCAHCYAAASGIKVDTRSRILAVGNPSEAELLKSAATLTREMKAYDKVSSLRGPNTLLQGQQNKGRGQRANTEDKTQNTEEQITEGSR